MAGMGSGKAVWQGRLRWPTSAGRLRAETGTGRSGSAWPPGRAVVRVAPQEPLFWGTVASPGPGAWQNATLWRTSGPRACTAGGTPVVPAARREAAEAAVRLRLLMATGATPLRLIATGGTPAPQASARSAAPKPALGGEPDTATRATRAATGDALSVNGEIGGMAARTWRVIKGVWTESRWDAEGRGGRITHAAGAEATAGRPSASERARVRATVARVLQLAAPEKKVLGVAVVSMLATTPMNLIMPAAVGQLLDVSVSSAASMSPLTVASMLLAVFAVQGVLMAARDALLAIAGERIAARLRSRTFASIMRQDMSFFDVSRTGELINRCLFRERERAGRRNGGKKGREEGAPVGKGLGTHPAPYTPHSTPKTLDLILGLTGSRAT